MTSMKTMVACLVNTGKTMSEPMQKDCPTSSTKLSVALTLMGSHMVQRVMASKTVEFSVVTYGSEKTYNSLNENQGGYVNIEEVLPMGTKNMSTIEDIYKIKASEESGDVIDGITVAQDILIRTNQGKKYNRVLLLFSDGETEIDPDGLDILNVCIQKMVDDGFLLYVCLLGTAQSSVVYIENYKMYSQMSKATGGNIKAIKHIGDGLCFLSSGPGLGSRPMNTKTVLQISPSIPSIPCLMWNQVMKQANPSLKKQSNKSYDPLDMGSGVVKRDTSYHNPADIDEVIEDHQKAKGYKYGKEYVPLTEADMDSLKMNGPAGVSILGYVPMKAIPRYFFMDTALILQTKPEDAAAGTAMNALCTVLRSRHEVGIARVVRKDNADPFLGCLIPVVDDTGDGSGTQAHFVIQRLPYAEDVREYDFPPLDPFRSKLSPEQRKTLSSYVDSLTYSKVSSSSIVTFNPVFHHLIAEIQNKRLKMDHIQAPIPDLMAMKTATSKSNVMKLLIQINQQFELTQLEKTTKKRKVYWSEIDIGGDGVGDTGDGSGSGSGTTSSNIPPGSVPESVTDSVLEEEWKALGMGLDLNSLAPAQDMSVLIDFCRRAHDSNNSLLYSKGCALLQSAVDTMQRVIVNLITIGNTTPHFKKASKCVAVLREAVLTLNTANSIEEYHNYVYNTLRTQFRLGLYKSFWDVLKSDFDTEHLILIPPIVSSHSKLILPIDSQHTNYHDWFFNEEIVTVMETPVVVDTVPDDDIFGEMM